MTDPGLPIAVLLTMPLAETIEERKTMKSIKFYDSNNPIDEDLEDFFVTDLINAWDGRSAEILA
jgi:hypothetical protein